MGKFFLTAAIIAFMGASLGAMPAAGCYGKDKKQTLRGGHSHEMGGDIMGLIEGLNLTPEQVKKVQEMRDADKRQVLKLRTDSRLAMLDLQDEYKKEKPDPKKINEAINKMADIHEKLLKIRAEHMLEIKQILTKEQFDRMMHNLDAGYERMKKDFFGGKKK